MADAGARKIKALLDTPSATLGTHMEAVRSGLRAVSAEGKVPRSTYDSISKVLGYFRRLHLQIEDTKTRSPAKRDVTAALFQMEAALANLSEGLKRGTGAGAADQMDKAGRRAGRASSDLTRASKRLA